MHTYRKSANEQLWTVGYWREFLVRGAGGSFTEHRWEPLSDHSSEVEAMERVNYLNGGARRAAPTWEWAA